MRRTVPLEYHLRAVGDGDRGALLAMYSATRREELQQAPWSDAERRDFLAGQFAAQDAHYREHYAGASFQVIEVEGRIAGRLYVDRRVDEMRIVDIIVTEAHRGTGLGTHILENLLAEARASGLPVRIHVEKSNPALRLYRRLGFAELEDVGVYWLMEWRPPAGG